MPIKILMPALSPTMTEGNLVKWHKKVGDAIKSGDLLAEIETDKATMEVEAVDNGVLGQIFVPEGTENVKVNSLIAALLEKGETNAALAGLASDAPVAAAAPAPAAPASQKAPAPTPQAAPQEKPVAQSASPSMADRILASPLAKRLATQMNIDLRSIQGSGPRGRIVQRDVETATPGTTGQTRATPVAMPTTSTGPLLQDPEGLFPPYTEVKLTNMRKVIAKRLTESKQEVPHFYLSLTCRMDNLLKARQDLNETLPSEAKISVNDFIIKAMASAMHAVPEANASWVDETVRLYQQVDISVAVAIEGGLVTPIVRNAQAKSLGQISQEMRDLIARARAMKLKPQEFQGGTISLSNLGMFGIENFSAVINPPQACILAVGASEKKPIVVGDKIEIATLMTCTLSVDHRVVDGAVGARYLNAFKACIENPIRMVY